MEWGIAILVATVLSLGILQGTVYGALIAAGLSILAITLWAKNHLTKWFLTYLGILLLGYAFLGRTVAYIGIPPLFAGEIVLGLGLLAFLREGKVNPVLRLPVVVVLFLFGLWGTVRTIPFIKTYGIDALRDGVIWGYAAFSILLATSLCHTKLVTRIPPIYQKFVIPFLLWVPISTICSKIFWPEVLLIQGLKSGDASVHLVGIAAFLILGFHRPTRDHGVSYRNFQEWGYWVLWLITFFLLVTQSRSSFLTVFISLSIVFLFCPFGRWTKLLIPCVLVGILAFAIDFEIDIGDIRKVSSRQAIENIVSIVSSEDVNVSELKGTKEWRLTWWKEIIDYTFMGKYFWLGKGFGINLADADGFQVLSEGHTLRSPHNGHLTILARTGVPGLILWVSLQLSFAATMSRVYFHSQHYKQEFFEKLSVWILAYWSACLINASFDVYLEGPQGGIWFWCIFGFGLAVSVLQKHEMNILRKKYVKDPTGARNISHEKKVVQPE